MNRDVNGQIVSLRNAVPLNSEITQALEELQLKPGCIKHTRVADGVALFELHAALSDPSDLSGSTQQGSIRIKQSVDLENSATAISGEILSLAYVYDVEIDRLGQAKRCFTLGAGEGAQLLEGLEERFEIHNLRCREWMRSVLDKVCALPAHDIGRRFELFYSGGAAVTFEGYADGIVPDDELDALQPLLYIGVQARGELNIPALDLGPQADERAFFIAISCHAPTLDPQRAGQDGSCRLQEFAQGEKVEKLIGGFRHLKR